MSVWDHLRKVFGANDVPSVPAPPAPAPPVPAPPSGGFTAPRPDLAGKTPAWISAAESPFGVEVLNVRPITLGTLSTTRDPKMAQNAVSYGGETGASFADEAPAIARPVDGALRYRAPKHLADGALFIPREMEDKWALFVQRGELVVVRGWQRRVFLRGALRIDGDVVILDAITGSVAAPDEPPSFTVRALDFIVRTHALRAPWPAPLIADAPDAHALAVSCMGTFGRSAHFASREAPPDALPERPLRTMSALHRAALHGDVAAIARALDGGLPADLEDPYGFTALHHVRGVGEAFTVLASRCPLDARSDDGTTALMAAVQRRDGAMAEALLARGAAADLADGRGFTALHRACEMGELAVVEALLARGADPERAASTGHTPRALAAARGEAAVVAALGAAR